MKNMVIVLLAAGAAVASTFALLPPHRPIYWMAAAVQVVLLALIIRRPPQWWVAPVFFGFVGIAHLIALWWLRARGFSSSALETFGPGYLLMAAAFYARHRWFNRSRV